jgi:hypothetical protein
MIKVLQVVGVMSLFPLPLLPALGPAAAQSGEYTIQPTGQPPRSVKPQSGNDDLVIQVPGRPPLHAKSRSDGSYTIDIPGHPPTVMNPRSDGGFVIQNPGQPPTYINPGR